MRSWLATGLAAALCAAAGGCAGDGGGDARAEIVLRVSAPVGVGSFEPAPAMEGAAAPAVELVYEHVSQHAVVAERSAATAVLGLRPESPMTAAGLAAAIRFRGLVASEAVGARRVKVTLASPADRAAFERWGMVDRGLFRVVDETARPVRLVRRDGAATAIEAIEIVETTAEEQWRRLHGRRLDVLPFAFERDRARLAGLRGVRAVEIDTVARVAVYFALASPRVADVAARRALAGAVDAAAVARVVCASERCAVPWPAPPDSAAPLPARLSPGAGAGDGDGRRAAAERQAGEGSGGPGAGPAVALAGGRQSATSTGAVGDAGADYGRAGAAGGYAAADRILARDVAMLPLYRPRLFAVVGDRFCGDVHPSATSWRWLADLRPCAPGESP